MGLSDFHAMIVTVLKSGYVKRGPKIITYRNYSRFGAVDFRAHLSNVLSYEMIGSGDYGAFEAVVIGVLNEHAPVKRKSIRANDYGTRKSPQLDKPGFSQINLVFLQINLVYLKKPHFSGEKPGLSEIRACESHHN